MTRLFDSTVLIAHLRGERAATDLLRAAVTDGALASVLSRIEIEGGMRSDERADVARLFTAVRLEPVTDSIASRAGAMLRRFRRSHRAGSMLRWASENSKRSTRPTPILVESATAKALRKCR